MKRRCRDCGWLHVDVDYLNECDGCGKSLESARVSQ